jgi:CAP12/Pycsar effector protein, TIR domain
MQLPVRTALADIEAICGYLITKPAGVSPAEVINEKALDPRKLSALKFWGLIEDTGTKLRLSERGLLVARERGAHRTRALRGVVAAIPPYGSIIARAVHQNEMIVLSTEIAAHWHQHFRAYLHLGILNLQIVCFLRIAEGANLGRLVVGRKGQQTRFELVEDDARAFLHDANTATWQIDTDDNGPSGDEVQVRLHGGCKPITANRPSNRVFITHRNNKKILEQVQELVAFGKFEPVVRDRETSARPFLHNLLEEMRGCDTAVVQVGVDGLLLDADRQPRISGDVLIEIGAAMALYGRNFVLLVEEGIELPSNLQGLCECRYSGDELDMRTAMKLLRAFSDFIRSQPLRPFALTIGADPVVPHLLQHQWTARSVQG